MVLVLIENLNSSFKPWLKMLGITAKNKNPWKNLLFAVVPNFQHQAAKAHKRAQLGRHILSFFTPAQTLKYAMSDPKIGWDET